MAPARPGLEPPLRRVVWSRATRIIATRYPPINLFERVSPDPAVWDALLAAEWMVADAGFGYHLRIYYQRTDMTVVYVYLILLGLAGFLMDVSLTWARRKLCPWYGH